jgi:hemerythrin
LLPKQPGILRSNDKYLTMRTSGITEIDDQHLVIMTHLESLQSAVAGPFDHDVVFKKLLEALEVVKAHFEYEEDLMEELDYFDLEDHKLAHQSFLKVVVKHLDIIGKDQSGLVHLITLIYRWYKSHIQLECDLFLRYLDRRRNSTDRRQVEQKEPIEHDRRINDRRQVNLKNNEN